MKGFRKVFKRNPKADAPETPQERLKRSISMPLVTEHTDETTKKWRAKIDAYKVARESPGSGNETDSTAITSSSRAMSGETRVSSEHVSSNRESFKPTARPRETTDYESSDEEDSDSDYGDDDVDINKVMDAFPSPPTTQPDSAKKIHFRAGAKDGVVAEDNDMLLPPNPAFIEPYASRLGLASRPPSPAFISRTPCLSSAKSSVRTISTAKSTPRLRTRSSVTTLSTPSQHRKYRDKPLPTLPLQVPTTRTVPDRPGSFHTKINNYPAESLASTPELKQGPTAHHPVILESAHEHMASACSAMHMHCCDVDKLLSMFREDYFDTRRRTGSSARSIRSARFA